MQPQIYSIKYYEYEGWLFGYSEYETTYPITKTGDYMITKSTLFMKMLGRFTQEENKQQFLYMKSKDLSHLT